MCQEHLSLAQAELCILGGFGLDPALGGDPRWVCALVENL